MIANQSLAAEPSGREPSRRAPARRLRLATAAVALVSTLAVAGCSQNKEAFTKRLDQLRVDIVQLRAENLALQDRVAELEDRDQRAAPARPPVSSAADRPELKVIRLTPDTGPADPSASANAESSGGLAAAADSDEPPLDLKLDDEASSSKTYRYNRPPRPTTRPALKR